MNEVTLKTALNRIMLITLALVGVAATGTLFGYSQIKQTLSAKTTEEGLTQAAASQVEALIPSFLVQEQKSGTALLLQRFRESENLSRAEIIDVGQRLPDEFRNCRLAKEISTCHSLDGRLIGVSVPIQESGHLFGHLFKATAVQNPLVHDHLLQMIEFGTGLLVFTFFIMFLLLSRVTAREVPTELGNLVGWIESVLTGETNTRAPDLKFRELNELGAKIAEVLERHERARDQAVVGQLTSGIMHDIKTPLHSIVTAQQLVEEQESGTEKRLNRLENLFAVCTKKLPLVGDIIETTLDGARAIHIDPKALDLRETIDAAIELHSSSLAQRKARIDFASGDSPIVVSHDPIQLGRVFSNVLRNSIEALPKSIERRGVPVDIRVSMGLDASGEVRVAIEDAGPGLPENPESVFRIFRSSKPRGTGLGLVIARKIVEAHQGRMTASRSEELEGARFDIFIPYSGTSNAPTRESAL